MPKGDGIEYDLPLFLLYLRAWKVQARTQLMQKHGVQKEDIVTIIITKGTNTSGRSVTKTSSKNLQEMDHLESGTTTARLATPLQ